MVSGASEKVTLRAGFCWFAFGRNTAIGTQDGQRAGTSATAATIAGAAPRAEIPPTAVPGTGAPKGTCPGAA